MVATKTFYETTREERIEMAKAMDRDIINIGDELIWSDWIRLGIPDCADEEAYEWFADDEYEWKDLCELYKILWKEAIEND